MYHLVSEQTAELRLSDNVLISSHTTQYLKCFQLEAVRFLYNRLSKQEFCIFNDESGLGKCASVVALLNGLGAGKKTLIVLQNDDQLLAGWQFHLGVLTDLPVCVLKDVKDSTESAHSVYLSKWSVLRSIGDLSKLNFDYIIVDHRGYTLNNSFCTSMLLKQFERKVNIVISSIDITSDVKLLYNVLRLGGCLEHQHKSFRSFERKFHLPDVKEVLSKRVDLEEYYKQRGVLGEYIKDFRLRRYRHQFDSYLPLVTPEQYKCNLSLWLEENNSNVTLSGSTIESLSEARSTGATDEIFESIMQIRQERELAQHDEPEEIASSEPIDEVVAMEPLVFEMSDSEAELVATKSPSNAVVLLSSDDCEIVTPPHTPPQTPSVSRSAPTPRNKRKYTKRMQVKGSKEHTESETDQATHSETEQPTHSKSKSRKLNVRINRILLPQINHKLITSSSKTKTKQLENPTTDVSKNSPKQKTIIQVEQLLDKPKQTTRPSTSKQITHKNEKPPANTRKQTTGPSTSKQITPKNEKPPVNTPKQTTEPSTSKQITPKNEKPPANTPKTAPRSKRNKNCDDDLLPRQTRGMQRKTRSADSRLSGKYIAPKTFIGFDKKATPKKRHISETPKTSRPNKEEVTVKKEPVATPKKSKTKQTEVELKVKQLRGRRTKENSTPKPTEEIKGKKLRGRPSQKKPESKATEVRVEDKMLRGRPAKKTSVSKATEVDDKKLRDRPAKKTSVSKATEVEVEDKKLRGQPRKEKSASKSIDVKPRLKKLAERPPKAKHETERTQKRKISNESTSLSSDKNKENPIANVTVPDSTPELLSSGSILSDYSYMQCAQKLPEHLELPQFRMPYVPQATPLLLPSTLNFFSESEVSFIPESNQPSDIVVINSSHDESSGQSVKHTQSRRTRALKRKHSSPAKEPSQPSTSSFGVLLAQQRAVNKSPDIFSPSSDWSQLQLGQPVRATSPFEGFKIFGSEVKQLQQQHAMVQPAKKKRERSCLDILEQMFEPQKTKNSEAGIKLLPNLPSPQKSLPPRRFTMLDDDIFEITSNGEFGSRLRLNSNGNVSPVPQQQPQLTQRNKITNYLISSGGTPEDALTQRTQHNQAVRKSPKGIKSTQSTKLTRWFGTAAAGSSAGGGESQSVPSTPIVPVDKVTRAREVRSAAGVKRKRLSLCK